MVIVDKSKCDNCGTCVAMCSPAALRLDKAGIAVSEKCVECGACVKICPIGAIRSGIKENHA